MDRFILIDSHAIIHRAYHAYPKTLKMQNGKLMNAVYGFTSILLTVIRHLNPKYIACAFDLPKPTFRHKKFKDYKAHRPKVDDELIQQIPKAKNVVKTLNIPIFEKEGFEADDMIGTLAKSASKTNFSSVSETLRQLADQTNTNIQKNCLTKRALEIIIVTGDKDALQLIDNNIKVFMPGRGKRPAKMVDRKVFIKEYSFEPRQLIDYKALCGDASDNIPGVKGIGPKTATDLIVKFGNLKEIYENLDKMESKVIDKLIKQKKQAFLSLKLAEIVIDAPIKLNLKKCRLLDYNKEKVVKLFEELEFNSLLSRLPGHQSAPGEAGMEQRAKTPKNKNRNKQMGLFKLT